MDNDITTISIDGYEQPEVTIGVRKKIDRLQRITNSIEQNLIQTAGKKDNIKKFKIDYECAEQSSLVLAGASPVWAKISHQPSTDPHSGKVSGKSMREGRQRAVAKAKVG